MIYHYNGVPIFYQHTGNGPDVVLIHGFLERSVIWFRWLPELTKNHKVLTLDLPGHGKSGCLSDTHTMEQMADVVYSLFQHLSITSATVVGHSMGGYVSLALAERHGSLIKRLVLLNTTTRADNEERRANRERALAVISENKRLFINTAIDHLFTENAKLNFASEISTLKEQARGFPVAGIAAAIRGMMDRKDRTEVLKNFRRKKDILCGDKDPIVPLAESKEIAAITNSDLRILKGGHMSWLENISDLLTFRM